MLGEETVAGDHATEVLVDNHGGNAEGVEEDDVGGLGADAGEVQEILADGRGVLKSGTTQGCHATAVGVIQERDEGFEGGSFAPHEAGGADEGAEFGFRNRAKAAQGEGAVGAEAGNGELDGLPGGVLGEVGADDDFEGRLCGPPLLRTPGLDEAVVHGAEAAGGRRHTLQVTGYSLRG